METWYILEDGAPGDPIEIGPDDEGVLRHKDGRAVAYAPHGPRSRMVTAEDVATYRTREVEAEKPKRQYRTREVKAD